jgi:hypothetical protein
MQDPALLQAALEGLEGQWQRIDEQIRQVRALLGQRGARRGRPPTKNASKQTNQKRVLSPAARKRIAAAQKKRWAQFRKNNPEPAE